MSLSRSPEVVWAAKGVVRGCTPKVVRVAKWGAAEVWATGEGGAVPEKRMSACEVMVTAKTTKDSRDRYSVKLK